MAFAWPLGCGSSGDADRDVGAPLTASGNCRTRAERCNAQDDDCDGIVDERADTSCDLAHAAASCVRGGCVIETCALGYADCNGLTSDGCETRGECGAACAADCEAPPQDAGAARHEAPLDASTGRVSTGQTERPALDEADGGATPDATTPDPTTPDATTPDATTLDATVAAVSCETAAPTGQGPDCDRCACNACPEALAACTGTDDAQWNTLCGELLACFGEGVQAGLCTGEDSDCFQNGDGPCVSEFRAAFARGWSCTADPVRTPCGALTQVRLACFKSQCALHCKA